MIEFAKLLEPGATAEGVGKLSSGVKERSANQMFTEAFEDAYEQGLAVTEGQGEKISADSVASEDAQINVILQQELPVDGRFLPPLPELFAGLPTANALESKPILPSVMSANFQTQNYLLQDGVPQTAEQLVLQQMQPRPQLEQLFNFKFSKVPAEGFVQQVQPLIESAHNPSQTHKAFDVSAMQQLSSNEALSSSQFRPLLKLDQPVTQSGWGQALGQRVVWMANSRLQTAEIQLDPPELGRLDVQLKIQAEHTQIVFSAEQLQAKEALEQALPKLKEMFSQAGFADLDVSVSHGQSEARSNENAAASKNGLATPEAEQEETELSAQATEINQGLVDYYV